MSYYVNPTYVDLLLDGVANLATRCFVCSEYPTTYAEASATYMLVSITLTAAVGAGDWTKGDGDTDNSRRLTMLIQTAATVTNTGDATHIAICNAAGSILLLVTECNETPMLAGQTVDVDTFTYTVRRPQSA